MLRADRLRANWSYSHNAVVIVLMQNETKVKSKMETQYLGAAPQKRSREKMKSKKFVSLALAFLLMLTLIPVFSVPAFAAGEASPFGLIFQDGIMYVDEGTPWLRYTGQGDKWSYDSETSTLMLDGFEWYAAINEKGYYGSAYRGIQIFNNENINLTGINSFQGVGYGIDAANISITGNGTLNASVYNPYEALFNSWYIGFHAANLKMESGNLNAFGSALTGKAGIGVDVSGGVLINGGNLYCVGGEIGLKSWSADINIYDGTVTAIGGDIGILNYAQGSTANVVNVYGGTLIAQGGTCAISGEVNIIAPSYTYWTNDPDSSGVYYSATAGGTPFVNNGDYKYIRIETTVSPVELDSIEITDEPAKTVYMQGEALDLVGLAVTAKYSDESVGIITDYTTMPEDGATLTEIGAQAVIVSYIKDGITKTATFDVIVSEETHTCVEDGGTITTPATCEADGVVTFKCELCGEILRTEPIPAFGHNYTGAVTSDATCAKKGVMTYTCSICGDIYTEPIEKDLNNHVGGTYEKVIKPATLETDGVMGIYCVGCDELLDTRAIPKLPSTPDKTDIEFLQENIADILLNGLKTDNLRLNDKVLTLVIDGRAFVLSTNANNRNISGEIALEDGYYLIFDIKGNGSNIKEFRVIQK